MDLGEEGSGRWDRNDKVFFFLATLGLRCCTGSLWLQRVGARVCGLSGRGTRAWLLCGTRDLVPRPGIEPVGPALAGRLLTTGTPGKARTVSLMNK